MSDKPILVYLASPYSHPDRKVRKKRFVAACRAADALMREGLVVFSPIAHSHPIEVCREDNRIDGAEFWLKQDFPWLDRCGAMVTLEIDGWSESFGIAQEVTRFVRRTGRGSVHWNRETTGAGEVAQWIRESLEQEAEPAPESILTEADRLTSVDRRATYGHPSDNFGRIAQMLNAYLGDKVNAPLDATDVGMMQALTKIARHGHSRKRDNLTDLCGYARCVSVCEGYEE